VAEAVLVEMPQCPGEFSGDGQIGQYHRARGVIVPVVVWRELIRPHESPVLRSARQYARAPLVVPEALLGVVGRGIPGAVINEIELGIVGNPAPDGRA